MNKKPESKGRFICAWRAEDLGPSGTPENSGGICKECKRKFLEGGNATVKERVPEA